MHRGVLTRRGVRAYEGRGVPGRVLCGECHELQNDSRE